jgi:hypothetical protein
MARSSTSAVWIEDEVWDDAFATRVAPTRRHAEEYPARERIIPPERRQARALRPVPAGPEPVARGPVAAPGSARAPQQPAAEQGSLAQARRTVKIEGRGAERNLPWPGDAARRRPSRSLHERAAFRPDRLAMWAVFLGLLLVLMAALSAH